MVYLYWTLHFYTKLTHLALKLKKLRLYGTCGARLNYYNIYIYIFWLKSNFYIELTYLTQKFKT